MLIEISKVTKIFHEQAAEVRALGGVSLAIEEGAFMALSGPSGSGKTTLLNLIGCLDRPTSGKIVLDGQETSDMPQQKLSSYRLRKIGFIFQDYNLIPTFTAAENIEYVLWLQGVNARERRQRALAMCERFNIGRLSGRRPSEMSRGQQQRVAVARALVHSPRLVLGDELTANLDHKTGRDLMEFLRDLNRREGMTFIYATHDPVMLAYADKVIKMEDGILLQEMPARSGVR
jgi:putative ABC transport system ATP-binding protein